jgi:PTH1 family peptidyl-tRNA hydrolase
MKLVVGLGNPGKKYEDHRHNLGFMVVSRLASRHNILLTKKKFNAIYSKSFISDKSVILTLPLSFMNLSGGPVSRFAHFYKIPITDIIVIADDLNLDFGRIRIRKNGSNGGHNGIKSIIEHLGAKDFSRVRLGIGLPFNACDVSGYVLSPFSSKEKEFLHSFIDKSTDALETIITESIEQGMNEFNS